MIGTIRFIGLRCVQVIVYSSVIFNWIGVKPGFWSVFLPTICGIFYGIVDYYKIIPQEQSFTFRKNPKLMELERKIDEIIKRV